MNALEGKLEAMVITKPDRKTKQGKKQAYRIWYPVYEPIAESLGYRMAPKAFRLTERGVSL